MKRSLELSKMNVRVGIMSLLGFTILVWVLFFPVRGASFFSQKISVTGFYERVDGLRRNAPVYYRGIEVGSVKSIEIDPTRVKEPLKVVATLEKRILYLLPKTTRMDISAQGLLGDVFITLVADVPRTESQPQLAEGDVVATKPYDSVLAGMSGVADKVSEAVGRVNAILAQVQSGKGMVGRLIHEDDLYKELIAAVHELKNTAAKINEIQTTINTKLLDDKTKQSVDKAVASAQRMIDSADRMTAMAANVRWHLTLGMEKYEGALYGAGAGLRIIPNKDRFYEGGLTYFNQALTSTAFDTMAGGYAGYNAWLGWRVLGSPVFFRGGLKRTAVAAGLDFRLGDVLAWVPVEISADAYRFGNAVSQFDLGASVAFLKSFRLTGGVEDMGNTPRYKMGLTLIYDDEDLTSILVKAKTGL